MRIIRNMVNASNFQFSLEHFTFFSFRYPYLFSAVYSVTNTVHRHTHQIYHINKTIFIYEHRIFAFRYAKIWCTRVLLSFAVTAYERWEWINIETNTHIWMYTMACRVFIPCIFSWRWLNASMQSKQRTFYVERPNFQRNEDMRPTLIKIY